MNRTGAALTEPGRIAVTRQTTEEQEGVMYTCADCVNKPCRSHQLDRLPGNCPTAEYSEEQSLERYKGEEKEMAYCSARVEGDFYCRITRVEETMEYALRMGYTHLGVAFCVGLSEEARRLVRILRANHFEVDAVCCKNGSVPKSRLGITREQQAHPEREFEAICNPAAQAELLEQAGCDLAILLGLCVGHDTLFIRHCSIPCTVLAVKDRVMAHNPLGAIYMSEGYMKDRLYTYADRQQAEAEA